MGNLVRADDFRPPAEWTDESRPVLRKWQYDSYSRLTKTTYTYPTATWKSPFAAENADPSRPQPSPHVSFDSRITEETFQYDWLNNLISNTDDSKGFYDRSTGTSQFANASQPHRLTSSSNRSTSSTRKGELAVAHDDIGQVTALIVQRDGPCLPTGSSCWSRYGYEWDEVGNLTRARRWDLTTTERTTYGTAASVNDAHPSRDPEVEMLYQYDGGSRVTKTVVRNDEAALAAGNDGPKYTVYPLSTLELRSTKWAGQNGIEDYELSAETTELSLPAGSVTGRVVSNGVMPRTGESQQHLLLTFSDQLGSGTFTIDYATSELVEYVTYTSYGQTESDYRTDRWDNRRNPTRFTGKEEDIEVGLNYHAARYYSPAMKRWMSADPVTVHSAGSDINPWSYGYGNPTAYVDPDGRNPLVIAAVVGAVIGAAVYTYQNWSTASFSGEWMLGLGVAAGSGALAGLTGGAVGMGVAAGIGASAAAGLGGSVLIGATSGVAAGAVGYGSSWAAMTAAKGAGMNVSTEGYSFAGMGQAMAMGAVLGGAGGAVYWGGGKIYSALSNSSVNGNAAAAAEGPTPGSAASATAETAGRTAGQAAQPQANVSQVKALDIPEPAAPAAPKALPKTTVVARGPTVSKPPGVALEGPQPILNAEARSAETSLGRRFVDPSTLRGTEELRSPAQASRMGKVMGGENGYNSFGPIEGVEYKGEIYIIDGHHRAAAAIQAGLTDVPVTVRPAISAEEGEQLIRDWVYSQFR